MRIILFVALAIGFLSCKRIKGNGDIITETRKEGNFTKISSAGSFDVEVSQDSVCSIQVEAESNLIDLVITTVEDGKLKIKFKDRYSYSTKKGILIKLKVRNLEQISMAGAGKISSTNQLKIDDKLKLSIAGSGNIDLDINAPIVDADIAGSGDIILTGQTRDAYLDIAGSGSYKCEGLLSEKTKVHIAGSGSAKVYAENKLDVHVAGSGDVFYKGSAVVTKKIAGSGDVKKLD